MSISVLLLLFLSWPAAAAEPTTWEFRACADPNAMPFTGRAQPGYENLIAEIIADELGAELTYDWSAFTEDLINLRFGEGECDVILGIPDGFESGITTVTYYQSPYMMVYRADSGITLSDLDDPELRELRIGVQGQGLAPHEALRQRDLLPNVAHVYGGELGDDHLSVMIRGVEAGDIDIGFGWGPAVTYFANRSDTDLVVKPVLPEFDLPSIIQSVPMSMGVRRGDDSLRDLLNVAIAARWDEIQAVLASYDVPVLPMGAPFLGQRYEPDAPTAMVALIVPSSTGVRTFEAGQYNIVGNAARMGAQLAEAAANANADQRGTDIKLLLANTPNAASAKRAADRLLSVQGAQVVIGGLGAGQAEVLASEAAASGAAFLNIGSSSLHLREKCPATLLNVAPSGAQYVASLVASYRSPTEENQGWVVLADDSEESTSLIAAAATSIAATGDDLLDVIRVPEARPYYTDLIAEIRSRSADAVLIILSPADQLAFMGQAEDEGLTAILAPYPHMITQTRDFFGASVRYGSGITTPRLQAWEPSLPNAAHAALEERYVGRYGEPMDASGFLAWRAVTILAEALPSALPLEKATILDALRALDTEDEFGPASFAHNQLEVPLWLTLPNPNGQWGLGAAERLGVADLVGPAMAGVVDTTWSCQ